MHRLTERSRSEPDIFYMHEKMDPSTLLRDPWLSLRTLRLHCVSLRDPWRKLCGRLTERSRSVPIFSTCMKKRTLRRCSGILRLVYGPFDVAQGSWAKAIDSADAFHFVSFATKKTLKTYLHNRRFIL